MPIKDVGDAVREGRKKGWSRKQAIAIGLKAEGKARPAKKGSKEPARYRGKF